jgi:hypothetical protein
MRTRRRVDRTRVLGVLALIALLGLPLTLGGHHHATSDLARDCSACVVAHFSPVEAASPAAFPTPLVSQPLPLPAAVATITSFDRPAHSGRAPPTLLGDAAA